MHSLPRSCWQGHQSGQGRKKNEERRKKKEEEGRRRKKKKEERKKKKKGENENDDTKSTRKNDDGKDEIRSGKITLTVYELRDIEEECHVLMTHDNIQS